MTKHINKSQRIGQICKCGCGEQVPQLSGSGRPRVWIQAHKPGRTQAQDRMCGCNCGLPVVRMKVKGALPKYFPGHSPSVRKYPTRNKVP